MAEVAGRVGRARRGEHTGMYVQVERDKSDTGWHIWLLHDDPRDGPSEGWDIWADDEEQVLEWLGTDHLDVAWID